MSEHNDNNNGKWQLAFWIITGLFILFASAITNSVVANDRLARDRDAEIQRCMYSQYQEIIQRLARIETKVEK